MSVLTITPTLARQLAISCQKLAQPQPETTLAGMMQIFRSLGYIQIDPIRAVERTQFLVLWSRLGNYSRTELDTLLWNERLLFEYWAHAAAIVLTENYPIHHLQMRYFAQGKRKWASRVRAWLKTNESFRQHILARLRAEGLLAAEEVENLSVTPWKSGGWTSDRTVNQMFSFMWEQGDIVVAQRQGLRRKWALTEQHLPDCATHTPLTDDQAVEQALEISLKALGVATAKQISTYFIRGHYFNLNSVLVDLEKQGRIIPVSITQGDTTWPGQWYIHQDTIPLLEQLQAGQWQPRTTLLSPFDNLIIDRDRTELMWDFNFRLEIYVPKAKRQYGYYVLPILYGDRLIGRLDPRMDRKSGKLHINAIYTEPNTPLDKSIGQAISQAIADLALFLDAKEIVYPDEKVGLI